MSDVKDNPKLIAAILARAYVNNKQPPLWAIERGLAFCGNMKRYQDVEDLAANKRSNK